MEKFNELFDEPVEIFDEQNKALDEALLPDEDE